MDRWIDLIAASYGMPRIVLLRELHTKLNLAREVAKIVARQQEAEAAEEAKARAKEDEMRAYLAELKAEQEVMRAEQSG